MTNNLALDVAIGLVFIYLLYSLLASIIQEMIAQIISLRARVLYDGIKRMLEDNSAGKKFVDKFYNYPSVKFLGENDLYKKPSYLDSHTFSQTIIHLLTDDNLDPSKSQMQAIKQKLDDELKNVNNNKPCEICIETLKQFRNLYNDAHGDIDKFKFYLEQWFDTTMKRTSGWYKRRVQYILLILGLVISIAANVDSIKIFKILSVNKTARDQIVQMAIQSHGKLSDAVNEIKQKQKDTTVTVDSKSVNIKAVVISSGDTVLDRAYKSVQEDADNAQKILGMGWHSSKAYNNLDSLQKKLKYEDTVLQKNEKMLNAIIASKNHGASDSATCKQEIETIKNNIHDLNKKIELLSPKVYDRYDGLLSIIGWLITALALSLGAPFWFDLLNKLVSMRSSGSKPSDNNPKKTGNKKSGAVNSIKQEPLNAVG